MTAAVVEEVEAVGPVLVRRRREVVFWGAIGFLALLVLVAIFAPWLSPHDPNAQSLSDRLQAPGGAHLLGTDEFGRDQLSRLIHGTRVSLSASVMAVTIGVVLGVPLGLIAGFVGRWGDAVLSRINDGLMSVPGLILALTVVAVLGRGLTNAMLAVGLVFTPTFFRVARASTKDVREDTFIEASEAIGCSSFRTVWRHVLPNALPPLLVQGTVTLGVAVSAEASLSFIGLGITPPDASWGSMLSTAFSNMRRAPYLVYAPGLMITLTVLAFSLTGDGLRRRLGTRRFDPSDMRS